MTIKRSNLMSMRDVYDDIVKARLLHADINETSRVSQSSLRNWLGQTCSYHIHQACINMILLQAFVVNTTPATVSNLKCLVQNLESAKVDIFIPYNIKENLEVLSDVGDSIKNGSDMILNERLIGVLLDTVEVWFNRLLELGFR